MKSRSVVLPPPFNPFEEARRDPYLPTGERITMLLSKGRISPQGTRAVSGEVAGYAVRDRSTVDVTLRAMVTWLVGSVPEDMESLPTGLRSIFRITLRGSLRQTLSALRRPGNEGRQRIRVIEIPCTSCWKCGHRLHGAVFCPSCGWRASIGPHARRPSRRSHAEGASVCPGCWTEPQRPGRYCDRCGFDRSWAKSVAELADIDIQVMLMHGHDRLGRVRAHLDRLAFQRVTPNGGPELLARVSGIEWMGKGRPTLDPEFRTVVTFGGAHTADILDRLRSSQLLRAHEPLRVCAACHASSRQSVPRVRSTHCTLCGNRMRILEHPSFKGRLHVPPPLHVRDHSCGTSYLPGKHRHCGGCGDSLDDFEPGGGRFAQLL